MTITSQSPFTERLNNSIEQHPRIWGACALTLFFLYAVLYDCRDNLWEDELYTLSIATLPDFRSMIGALMDGADGAPPLYAFLVRMVLPFFSNTELAVRLPSTIGYAVMIVCVFQFCRRRMPGIYAATATLMAWFIGVYYASEGRAYGLILGGAAAALLGWQAAAEGRHRRLALSVLAVSLPAMTALHYFSIFLLVPLGLAELFRWRRNRSIDYAVAATMLSPLLILLLHYPLIRAGAAFQAHYWSPAEWAQIPRWYHDTLVPLVEFCIPSVAALVLARSSNRAAEHRMAPMPGHERVAVAALILLPAFLIPVSVYTTYVYVGRYAEWCILGNAIGLTAFLCAKARGNAAVALTVALVVLAMIGWRGSVVYRALPRQRDLREIQQDLNRLPNSAVPIVLARHYWLMELDRYAEPAVKKRIMYAVSRERQLRYQHNDSGSLLMAAQRRWSKLNIMTYDETLAHYPHFLVVAHSDDYLPRELAASGRIVTKIKGFDLIYDVTVPTPVPADLLR